MLLHILPLLAIELECLEETIVLVSGPPSRRCCRPATALNWTARGREDLNRGRPDLLNVFSEFVFRRRGGRLLG